jgi:hypothetical protein
MTAKLQTMGISTTSLSQCIEGMVRNVLLTQHLEMLLEII